MNQNEIDYNRRDFLKGGSVATLMTMLGGVELFAETAAESGGETKPDGPRVKVGVIGLGAWGREILTTLGPLQPANVAAICDNYPAALTRAAKLAPGATQTADYKIILANPDIKAVIIATPTQLHKEIAVAALKAGKHVYCEAPLANSIADAREIALAGKAANRKIFQAGLQWRADAHRQFIVKNFIRPGAIGEPVLARAQWHKKTSWRSASPNPEREKALNWRLDKSISLGLVGEIGIHSVDQVSWFYRSLPLAVTGFGSILLYKDGREVPDTIQAMYEFPDGVNMMYDATLANSFDGEYEMFFGTFAAIMARDHKAWLFKEADSPLLGWEIYSTKQTFYKESGIVLGAGATKSTKAAPAPAAAGQAPPPEAAPAEINEALSDSLNRFVRNSIELDSAAEDFVTSFGADDADALTEHLSKIRLQLRPTAGYLEGFQATVTAVKANEAVLAKKRIELQRDWYELK
jgi:predicted dehydrogenase